MESPSYRAVVARKDAAAAGTVAVGLAFVTVTWFMQSGHAYGYDEGVTVGYFVQNDSLLAAVTTQRVFNNHPLLTAVDWLIWHAGGRSEAWMRVAPLIAALGCITAVGWWAHRRQGLLPTVGAVAIACSGPLLVEQAAQARGYAFAALAVTISTILSESAWRTGRWRKTAYTVCVFAGLASHLYVALVIVAHGAAIAVGRRELLHAWFRASWIGGLFALFVYAPMLPTIATASRDRDGSFDPDFPTTALDALFGSMVGGIVAGCLVVGGLIASRRVEPRIVLGVVLGLLGVVWVVVQPFDLYPRFLIWATPLTALAIAPFVRRHPVGLVPTLLVAALAAPTVADTIAEEGDTRAVADSILAIHALGQPCTLGYFSESLRGYLDPLPPDLRQESDCDVVFLRRADVSQLPEDMAPVGRLPDSEVCAATQDPEIAGILHRFERPCMS